mmetsp:Transcript_60483/g.128204  ORF Transcript_60483/g.128204 Transcript_60483/m.128204 type:complete len:289 (-) Transcript_60483:559-1425(-)
MGAIMEMEDEDSEEVVAATSSSASASASAASSLLRDASSTCSRLRSVWASEKLTWYSEAYFCFRAACSFSTKDASSVSFASCFSIWKEALIQAKTASRIPATLTSVWFRSVQVVADSVRRTSKIWLWPLTTSRASLRSTISRTDSASSARCSPRVASRAFSSLRLSVIIFISFCSSSRKSRNWATLAASKARRSASNNRAAAPLVFDSFRRGLLERTCKKFIAPPSSSWFSLLSASWSPSCFNKETSLESLPRCRAASAAFASCSRIWFLAARSRTEATSMRLSEART